MKHGALIALALIATAVSTCARGATIGGCPLPLVVVRKAHHARHVAPLPLCSCVAEPPPVILPAEPDITPIELSILRYYVPLTADTAYEPQPYQWDPVPWGTPIGGWRPPTAPSSVRAPEIDTRGGVTAVTILALIILIATGRRPRS